MTSTKQKDVKIKVELSEKQYLDLIKLVALGNSVTGILGDVMPEKKYKKESDRMEELESHLLNSAIASGSTAGNDLIDEFSAKVVLDSEYYENEILTLLDQYDDYSFWSELETRLGKRDFHRTITKEEKAQFKKSNWYPERVHKLYKKYREEFEKHALENVEVKFKEDK